METHGETAFPGRLTGRDKPRLEACAWKDGVIELRFSDDKYVDRWTNLELSLGDLLRWYRQMRLYQEQDTSSLATLVPEGDDSPLDGLGAR